MFNFFRKKRRNVYPWEVDMIINIFRQLPGDNTKYVKPFEAGLVKKLRINYQADLIDYQFTLTGLFERFEDRNEPDFKLDNVEVFDIISQTYIDISILIFSGLAVRYSIPRHLDKVELNGEKIDLSKAKKVFFENNDYNRLVNLLGPSVREHINKDDVYVVELDGVEYYHIAELGDGDFIGVGPDKKVYALTHDPYEIKLIYESLEDYLKNQT